MEKSALDHLMERYVRGEVSEAERLKIEAWLDVMGAEDNTDLELTQEEEDRIFAKLTSGAVGLTDVAKLKPRKKARADRWLLRIAASLFVVCVLSYSTWYLMTLRHDAGQVSEANVEKIILDDGSLVWLRGGTKVLYREKPDERTRYATFEGEEALFEVTKDADRPFIVECGNTRVTVLGTSFSIRSTDGVVEVTVLTGRVNLSTAADPDGIDLLPQEKAICQLDGSVEKVGAPPDEIATLTEHTEYDMHFESTNMAEVLRKLEAKFNVTMILSDESIGNCRMTIDLTDKSLDHSLRLVSEVLGLTYEIEQDAVTINGSGCK